MEIVKSKMYYIRCRTGCSCCSSENFSRGLFLSQQSAQAEIDKYLSGKDFPLCSQFARYGIYKIVECDAETLPDGRVIIEDNIILPASDTEGTHDFYHGGG